MARVHPDPGDPANARTPPTIGGGGAAAPPPMIQLTRDRQLVARFRTRRDPEAFAALVRRTLPSVERVLRRFRVGENERDDLIQETYLAVLVSIDRFDPSRDFRAWVRGIARHTILSAWSRRSRPAATGAEPEPEPTPPEVFEARELRLQLVSAIERLPHLYRSVLQLHYVEQLSHDEIATRLASKPSTVRTRLSRGLDLLRRALPRASPLIVGWLALRGSLAARARRGAAPLGPERLLRLSTSALVALSILGGGGLWWWLASSRPPAPASPVARLERPLERPLDRPAESRARPPRPPLPAPDGSSARPAESEPRTAPTATLAITIVDARSQEPVPHLAFGLQHVRDVELDALEAYEDFEPRVTDADGRAVVGGVEHGRLRVRFAASVGSEVFEIDGDRELVVEAHAVARFAGRVLEGGVPVARAEVRCMSARIGSFLPSRVVARTDVDGRFRVAFAGGAPRTLWAVLPGRSRSRVLSMPISAAPPRDHDFELEAAAGRIAGVVRDVHGAPSADTLVVAHRRDGLPADSAVVQVHTDAHGHFELATLFPDEYRVFAVARDSSVALAHTPVLAGTVELDLALELGPRVEGRVTDRAGRPAAGYLVGFSDRDPEWPHCLLWRQATTDADGRYALRVARAGPTLAVVAGAARGEVYAHGRFDASASGDTTRWSPVIDRERPLSRGGRYRFQARWSSAQVRTHAPGGTRPPRARDTLR